MRLLHSRTAARIIGILVAGVPTPCLAQHTNVGPPPVTWLGRGTGDSSGTAGHGDRTGALAIEPLRLSLLGRHPWTPLDAMSGCRDQAADTRSGGPTPGFMKTYAMNVFGGQRSTLRVPRLTLFGFSRGGCTLDGAAGAGATFIVPIRQDVLFVASAGAIYLPATGPSATSAHSTSVRADVVFPRADGRSLSIGIGGVRGTTGVQLGGLF